MIAPLPIIIVGAGGHAKVVADALLAAGATVEGLVDAKPNGAASDVLGLPILGDDQTVLSRVPATVVLANGVGSTGEPSARVRVFDGFLARSFHFVTVIHPTATIGRDVALGEGTQIMAGAILQPGSRIGRNVIINTGAAIDHDCRIDDHAHVAPGAVLGGCVTIGTRAHVGAGAVVIQNITVGADAVVGAGAVVIRDVPDGARVMGVPAAVTRAQQ